MKRLIHISKICSISARVIANKTSFKFKNERIEDAASKLAIEVEKMKAEKAKQE